MANMIPISTVTVGSGGAASIDFTGIPQTYTDLNILFSVRSTGNYNADGLGLLIKFNGSTSSFSFRALEGNGASAISFNNTTNQIAGIGGGSNVTANTFNNGSIYIPNYTGSNNKSFATDSVMENNGTTAADDMYASLWSNTAAITSITIYPSASNLAQYSSATLYGIRKY